MADIKPLPVSKVLQSPSFADEPLDEKFKILDDVRHNNLTHMGQEYSANAFTPDKYASEVERQNFVVRQAKNNLIQEELQAKLEDWAIDNDSSPDAARDTLLRFNKGEQEDIPESLNQILQWGHEKQTRVMESSSKAGFSGFNNVLIETDRGNTFGEGRIFQSSDGKTQAAVTFHTDENGQYTRNRSAQMVKLPDTYESTLADLEKRKNELHKIVDDYGSEPNTLSPVPSHANSQGVRDAARLELARVEDKIMRYTSGSRGQSEFFSDKLDEMIRADETLRSRIPQGSTPVIRPLVDAAVSLAEGQWRTAAGVTHMYGLATGDKKAFETARAFSDEADSIAQGREYYGMGQTRHDKGWAAKTGVILSEEVPQLALDLTVGAGASLAARKGVRTIANRVYRDAFSELLEHQGLRSVAKDAREALIDNVSRRWGAKIGAAVAVMPSSAQEAAFNMAQVFDEIDKMYATASELERNGKKEEAEAMRTKAIDKEQMSGEVFMKHFGSTALLEFLPMEMMLKRGERALDATGNVFAAAERRVKGVAAAESIAAGGERAAAFRQTVGEWMASRYGTKTMAALQTGSMEAITEVLQSMSDNRIAKEFYDEHRGLFEGVPEAAWGGLLLGSMIGFVGTRTNPAALKRAVNQMASNSQEASSALNETLSTVEGKPVGDVVAAAPKNVVTKVGATYRVVDPDMPEDTGFQNVEFRSEQEAEAFAERRWQAYTTNQINNALSQTRKEDGSPYTKQEIDDQLVVASTLVNSVADRNNVSRETLWKSMANSVTFAATDPALSSQNVSESETISALDKIREVFSQEENGDSWVQEIDKVKQELIKWSSLPPDQRGARPEMSPGLAIAVSHVNFSNKAAAAPQQAAPTVVKSSGDYTETSDGKVWKEGQEVTDQQELDSYDSKWNDNNQSRKDSAVLAQKNSESAPTVALDGPAIRDDATGTTSQNYRVNNNQGNVTVRQNGNEAYISDVQIGDQTTNTQNKGLGTKVYEKLGKELASKGVTLQSTRWSKHGSAISPQALRVWEKLAQQGLAVQTGTEEGKVYDRNTGKEEVRQIPTYDFKQNAPSELNQETPFEVWKSSVRRRFAPDAEPSAVEVAEIQRLQEVFGESAPVNPDGTLDVLGTLELLSEQEGPMGELAGLLSDIIPTLNLSDQKLRYRLSDELGTDGVTSPTADGDMTVGQSEKSTKVGTNASVMEFLHHMVTDTVGVLLDNYTASVGASISTRPAMQSVRPPGTLTSNWRPGSLAAENTPAGIESRVAYETAMPFAMVQRNQGGATSSSQSGATMKQMFVFNELSEILGGRPQQGLVQAVVDGNYSFGVNRPTQQTAKNYYLQTVADGRVVAWAGGAGRWAKLPFKPDDKSWKKYQFDTGWESRLARLYLREVMTSGMYDTLFDPQEGLAGTKMSRSEYLSQYGPDAPNYNLTSFSRFVQGVLMDPVFAMRVSKARYGFPAINVKDMVFGDVVNNALGARTLEPDPIKRFTLTRTLSLGQQIEASKIPALSPHWGPQTLIPAEESPPGTGSAAQPVNTGGARLSGAIPGKILSSTKSPQAVGAARESAQNYALSYQGSRQDVTGVDPSGERTADQIDPTELALRTPAELTYSPSGRQIGTTGEMSEEEGRAMFADVPSRKKVTGEDIGQLTEVQDMTEDEIDELQEILDEGSAEYYDTAFEYTAQKLAEEAGGLEVEGDVVEAAISAMGMDLEIVSEDSKVNAHVLERAPLDPNAESEVPASEVIDLMVVNPRFTVENFNQLLANLEGKVTDRTLQELAGKWVEYRVPAAVASLKESEEYKNGSPKTKGDMYRAAVAEVTPKGMTKAQSTRLGGDPIPEGEPTGSGLRREQAPQRDKLVEEQKAFSKSEGKQVTKLVGAPIKGVPSSQVLAVTGEDPVNILLEHVRSLEPERLGAAHDVIVALSEEFGFMPGDTLENSLGQIRLNPQDGASWLSAERVLYALRASKNPVAIVESMPSIMELKGVLWGLAQNPQLLADAHALSTAFTDSVALKFGEMGFQVKTKEVEEGDTAPKEEAALPGEDVEEGQVGEDTSGFVAIEGPRPGPSNEFINRVSRFNTANKGGNSTRIFPVGLRPFVTVNKRRVAISENTRWSKLDNRSVKDVYEELAANLGEEADTKALDKLYRDVWQRALSGEQGLEALAQMKDYVMKHRLENGTDLPLVSPEVGEARTSSPAIAISNLLNTELAQTEGDNPARRGFINTTTRLITILQNGDPTTFIHELTHWMRLTKNGQGMSLFDVALGNNRAAFMEWATDDGRITQTKEIEERIASGMESYLAGNTKKPFLKGQDKAVQSAFKRLAQTFRDIYNGMANMLNLDARARKGYDAVFSGGTAAPSSTRSPNLSITEMEAKRKKLAEDVTKRYAENFYRAQPRVVEPFEDWYPAFAEEIQLRGERLSKFVRYLQNEGFIGDEDASLLRWVPSTLPGIANDDEVNEMMRAASQAGMNAPTKEGIKDALNQEVNAPRHLMPRTVVDDSTQYPGDPVTLVGASSIPSELNQTGALRAAMRLKGRSFNRWWRANGNAPWSAFNALLERNGQKATIERDMLKIMKMAEDAIEKAARATGISNAQAARNAVNRDLNAYLIEQDAVEKHKLYTALPSSDIKRAALRMRQYVDGLSIYLTSTGVVRGPLASAINNKVGFYLHRSYQINSDPGWKENMLNGALKGVWEKAIDVIQTTRGISRDDAYNVGHEIMSSMGFANKPESSGISVDATILMSVSKQFADVQKAADMILGLKEDPLTNFTKTVEGMAQLISQNEFINKILLDGRAKGYVRSKNDPITAQNRHLTEAFFGDTSPVDPNLWTTNPALAHQKTAVAGYFTTPEISQWMTDVMQANMPTNAAHRMVNTLNGLFKTSNTVHNWVSGLRNVYSATIGVWAQGHTGKYLPKATSLVVRDSKLDPTDEALMKELMEHNIAESATLAELRDFNKRGFNLDEANKALMGANSFWSAVFSAPIKYANKLNPFRTSTSGAPAAGGATAEAIYRTARGFKKYDSARKKIYGGTDTVAKIAAYLEEKDRVKKMYPTMTPKEIKAEAARRTHMTMFSFDMLPKAVNEFRTGIAGLLWGPFVSFPYSMARTFVNTMAIGYSDMSTGYRRGGVTDPQFLDGSKRLGALTAMAWGTRAAVYGINAALMWDDEDEAAARRLMAPWDQDGNILFLTARGGEFTYINLSSLLPYSYITDAVSALVSGSAVKEPESVIDPVIGMMKQLVKPFAASQFFLDAVGNEAKNTNQQGKQIWIEGDTMMRNLSRVSGAFFAPLMAGDARNLVRLGLNPGDIGRFLGAKHNKDMDGWAKSAYAAGFKVSTINVEKQFPFQVKEWIRQYKTSTAGFYQQSTSRDPISKDDLRNSLQFAMDRHKLITRQASMQMNALMTRFGLSEDAILDAMDNTSVTDGFGKLNALQKQSLWDGEWVDPITISEQQYYSIENAAEAAGQPERLVWLEDLINEGLLDVQSGR